MQVRCKNSVMPGRCCACACVFVLTAAYPLYLVPICGQACDHCHTIKDSAPSPNYCCQCLCLVLTCSCPPLLLYSLPVISATQMLESIHRKPPPHSATLFVAPADLCPVFHLMQASL
jgi:hypothetical protein